MQPRSCKVVIVRKECTGWTVHQGFALWVCLVLAYWRVDGWVIIGSFLEMFWVSFWCFVYFIFTLLIFMHEGLYWEFIMLGLIIETLVFGEGRVATIELSVSLSYIGYFGIFAQQISAQMISEMWTIFTCCDNDFPEGRPINNPAACLSPAILRSESPSIQGVGSMAGGTSQDPRIADRIQQTTQWFFESC